MIRFDLSPRGRGTLTMVMSEEWPDRFHGMQGYVTYLAAKDVHEGLITRIPNDSSWGLYRNSLEVARVLGQSAYVIVANSRKRRLKKTNVKGELVYVRAKRRLVRVSPAASVLADFNPWTWDTLPHVPNRRFATLVVRRVNESDVDRVRTDRESDRVRWRRRLMSAGVRVAVASRLRRDRVDRSARAVVDIAHTALRLEFGLGTVSKVHWRPALRDLVSVGLRRIRRRKDLNNALMLPSYQRWRKWPPKLPATATLSAVKRYTAFQKRLGIRVAKK